MKILMMNDALVRGGKERRLVELLKGLGKFPDVEVDLVIFSNRIDYPEVHDHCRQVHILERQPRKDPRIFYRLYQLIQKLKPEIIHSWGSMPSVYALPAVMFRKVKFVNAMITNANKDMSWWHEDLMRAKLTFPFSDVVIGNSKAGLKAYHAPAQKSHCIYNGFDFKRAQNLEDPEEIRASFQIKTPEVVGMIGAFEYRKDYETYIQAALKLVRKRKSLTCLAVGKGENLPACQNMVPDDLKDRILFPGMVKNVESLIGVLDVGVLATNTRLHGEGISNAILEFMAMAKPVVATTGGGTPEIVEEGKTGFMVEPYNSDQMAERIEWILDHTAEALEMGENGMERVRTQFNLDHMAVAYLDIYDELLPGKRLEPVKISTN